MEWGDVPDARANKVRRAPGVCAFSVAWRASEGGVWRGVSNQGRCLSCAFAFCVDGLESVCVRQEVVVTVVCVFVDAVVFPDTSCDAVVFVDVDVFVDVVVVVTAVVGRDL